MIKNNNTDTRGRFAAYTADSLRGHYGMDAKFLKPYDPKTTEERTYKRWEESGFFNPDVCIKKGVTASDAPPFSIVLPPPNVTGTLHTGHAAMLVIEDIMVRFERMRGKRTLWVPGTDHAAIATESKVEAELIKNEKKTRHDLGRDAFLERVNAFAKESHDTIVNQVRRMGASLDWSREAYTLDEQRTLAVRTAFKRMYDAGLVYRGNRIVNWDPKLQTTVSDDEVEWKEETTPFYYLKYGPFTIGTARPETKFGDKYVVMHPDDERYKEYAHGQTIQLEWINGPITATVIKDPVIDMEFGTGVMTITPWHDATDFEIAERHNLAKEQIIDTNGKLLPIAGEFAGLHIKKARPQIVEKLKAKGLVERVEENYTHRIAANSRGNGVIEPQILRQWFVAVNKEFTIERSHIPGIPPGSKTTLKKIMRAAVESRAVQILPERFEKVYFHWIDNLRDWCISRQIWFGHRIPVWYRSTDTHGKPSDETYAGIEAPEDDGWEQDPDTLDTWFSSGLWTFSTLGWPDENAADFRTYHPTSILETGYDILFFWVARMVLMSGFLLGDIPFRTVYLHGLVRDEKGRKMSKSLGNIIDPVTFTEKYGADALRMALVVGVGPGNDNNLGEQKVKAYKLFANKLWNIARFVLASTENTSPDVVKDTPVDAMRREELQTLVKEITEDIGAYRFYLAGEKLYHYVWHTFADTIIEESKSILKGEDADAALSRKTLLLDILRTCLVLLHPFMPFITEEIWEQVPNNNGQLLMVSPWPMR